MFGIDISFKDIVPMIKERVGNFWAEMFFWFTVVVIVVLGIVAVSYLAIRPVVQFGLQVANGIKFSEALGSLLTFAFAIIAVVLLLAIARQQDRKSRKRLERLRNAIEIQSQETSQAIQSLRQQSISSSEVMGKLLDLIADMNQRIGKVTEDVILLCLQSSKADRRPNSFSAFLEELGEKDKPSTQ